MLLQRYNEIDQRVHYHVFLSCLFATVKKKVDKIISSDSLMTYEDLSSRWRMYLRINSTQGRGRSRRDQIYQEVVDNMKVDSSTNCVVRYECGPSVS